MLHYKGSLKTIQLEEKLIQSIANQLRTDFEGKVHLVKGNLDLLSEICSVIEDAVKFSRISKKKINKLELFFAIYERAFGGLDVDKKKELQSNIDFLNGLGKIKARSYCRYIIDNILGFLTKNE